MTLYKDEGATLDDLREAVTTLEETESTARRVLGRTHPVAESIDFILQEILNRRRERVLATKHAPRGPFRLLERRHGLAEIVERGAVVSVERLRAFLLHHERKIIVFSENALRRGYRSTKQRPRFFEELYGENRARPGVPILIRCGELLGRATVSPLLSRVRSGLKEAWFRPAPIKPV